MGRSHVRRRPGSAAAHRHGSRAVFEAVEPRVLMSAVPSLIPVAAFDGTTGQAGGELVADAAGNLYGTTAGGGTAGGGTLFEVAAGTGTVTTLASFDATTGTTPGGPLTIDSAGDLFGTTATGGANGSGTVYELPAESQVITPLASFAGGSSSGSMSQAPGSNGVTRDAAGDLFGTTPGGGANGDGTVFELPAAAGAITTLASFDADTTGQVPSGPVVVDGAGDVFATAQFGGTGHVGTLVELPAGSPTLTKLADFGDALAGSHPTGLVADVAGDLWGTTQNGGDDDAGTVFEYVPSTAAATTVNLSPTAGVDPVGRPLVDAAGDVFGTEADAPFGTDVNRGLGSVYELPAGTTTPVIIATLDPTTTGGSGDGDYTDAPALAGLTLSPDHDLYGVTATGGPGGTGTVYRLTPPVAAVNVTAQPSAAVTAGTPFGLTASLSDAFGPVAVDDDVSVSIDGGPVGSSLGGTATASAADGVVTFDDLVLTRAGSYTLSVTDGTAAGTAQVVVTPAAAAQLAMASPPPTTVTAGASFGVAVAVEDAYGNVVPTDASAPRIAFSSVGAPSLFGDPVATTSAGVATFNGLSINTAGTYAMDVTDGGLAVAYTGAFTVAPAAPFALAFAQQPTNATAGPLAAITVDVLDQYDNLVTTAEPMLTLSAVPAASGGAAGQLGGTTTATPVNGVATFAAPTLTTAGSYKLVAAVTPAPSVSGGPGSLVAATEVTTSDGPAGPVTSASFDVVAGPAAQLAFAGLPKAALAYLPIGPVSVAVQDAYGNDVLATPSTVTLAADSGGALGGTTSVTTTNGVATFSSLSLSPAGGRTLVASDPLTPSGTSAQILVQNLVIPGPFPFPLPTPIPTPTPTPTPTPSPVVTLPTYTAGAKLPAATVDLPAASDANSLATRKLHMAITSGPAGGTLSGTTAVIATHGHATFNNVWLTKAGQYTLAVTDTAGRVAYRQTLVVAPAAPRTLTVATPPAVASPAANATLSLSIQVNDRFGNLLTDPPAGTTVAVHVAFPSRGQHRPALAGGVAHAAIVDGVATFDGLPLTGVGTFRLMITCPAAATVYTTDLLQVGPAATVLASAPRRVRSA